MINFQFYSPTRFIFGKEEENNVGKYIAEYGAKKVMVIHYGTGLEFEDNLVNRVFRSLKDAGLEYVDFSGIKANPTYERAVEGSEIVKKENVDFLLAVGGGSVIDTAKFIGVDVVFEGDTWEYHYVQGNPAAATMPVGAILTIAATGSEGSCSSVITRGHIKGNMGGDAIRPLFSIMNPELTYTLPPYQTACGIVDMIAHVHERYFTLEPGNYVTDEICEAIFRTIIKYGPIAMKDPFNYEARANLMWAGNLAHNDTCGVGRVYDLTVHCMQMPISGYFNSAHGAGCGVLTLGWMKYVYKTDMSRFVRYFTKVWDIEDNPDDPEAVILKGIETQKNFYESLGMPTTLEGVGAKEEDISKLVDDVAVFPHGRTGNFKMLDRNDLINIYKLCL